MRRQGRVVTAVALLVILLGFVLTGIGVFGGVESSGGAAGLIGGGAVAVLLGTSLFSPRLVRPIASVVGRPIEMLFGITGRLARENTLRKPGRTAVTAAALMIGLALVVFVSVFAAGISKSVSAAVDRNFQGDLILQNIDGFSTIPAKSVTDGEKVPGVETGSALSFASAKIASPVSGDVRVSGADPRTVSSVLNLDFKKGSESDLRSLTDSQAIVDDAWAKSNDIGVGDMLAVRTPLERVATYRVVGTVKDNADLLGNLLVNTDSLRRDYGRTAPTLALFKVRPGTDVEQVKKAMTATIEKRYPTVDVLNQQELKDNQEEQVNQLVGLIYALLSLAVIVALFGIVNTLALSIHERTRELGHAARGGHVPAPGAADDPLRVGDHRAHRRRARNGARRDLRRAPHRAAGRRGLRAGLPGGHPDHPADRGRAGRDAGRHRPGAPRRPPRRAAGPGVRVARRVPRRP